MTKKDIVPGDTTSIRLANNVDKSIVDWMNQQTSLSNSILYVIKRSIDLNGISDLSEETLPTTKEMLQIIFDYIASCSGDPNHPYGSSVAEIYDHCAKMLNVSYSQRNIPSAGNTSLFENRVRWGLQKLKGIEIAVIESTKKGFYKVTDWGKFCAAEKMKVDKIYEDMAANLVNRMIKNDSDSLI